MGRTAEVAVALYVNCLRVPQYSEHYAEQHREQMGNYAILREWVRVHIKEKPEMWQFTETMIEVDGRGYLFQLYDVRWGNDGDPFYLLLQRTLNEMAETFDCNPHSNCGTPYALEYSYVKEKGMEYDTVRLGNYAYAVGVKVEVEVAHDFMRGVE